MKQDKRRRLKPLIHMSAAEMQEALTNRLKRNGWWFNAATIQSLCHIVIKGRGVKS